MRRRGSGREGRTPLEAVSEVRRAAAASGEAPAGAPRSEAPETAPFVGEGAVSTCARAHRPMRACGRTRSERPHLSDDASGRSLVLWSRPCPPRRRPAHAGGCRNAVGRIEALVALVARRGPDGLCGALPDEDTRPEAVVERHEPSGLGVGGAACGELAVLWSGNHTRLHRPHVGQVGQLEAAPVLAGRQAGDASSTPSITAPCSPASRAKPEHAHAAPCSPWFQPSRSRDPGRRAACAPFSIAQRLT